MKKYIISILTAIFVLFVLTTTSFAAQISYGYCELCGQWAKITKSCSGDEESISPALACSNDTGCAYSIISYYTSYNCDEKNCSAPWWDDHAHEEDHTRCPDRYVCDY